MKPALPSPRRRNISSTPSAQIIPTPAPPSSEVGYVSSQEVQNLANNHHTQAAIDTYGAMLLEIRALAAARLIAGTCTVAGISFSPADVLIGDVRGLMANLKVGSTANPITGYVVNSGGVAVANATASLLNSTNAVVATATTDMTGFYFFATGGVLTSGSTYSVKVTGVPKPFHTSSPASQAFTWAGTGFELSNFVLN
jgi:hypothetical protein